MCARVCMCDLSCFALVWFGVICIFFLITTCCCGTVLPQSCVHVLPGVLALISVKSIETQWVFFFLFPAGCTSVYRCL